MNPTRRVQTNLASVAGEGQHYNNCASGAIPSPICKLMDSGRAVALYAQHLPLGRVGQQSFKPAGRGSANELLQVTVFR